MGISVISLLCIVHFVSMVASSGQQTPTWGYQNMLLKTCDSILVGKSKQGMLETCRKYVYEYDQNMQLKACDLILVGNSKQGILSAYCLTQ